MGVLRGRAGRMAGGHRQKINHPLHWDFRLQAEIFFFAGWYGTVKADGIQKKERCLILGGYRNGSHLFMVISCHSFTLQFLLVYLFSH